MKCCSNCNTPKKFIRNTICKGCDYKLHPEKYEVHKIRVKNYAFTLNGKFLNAKSQAKSRNIPWHINKEQYKALINNTCNYCTGQLPVKGVGLDRIDNNQGYVIDNVVPCCEACNSIKGKYLSKVEMEIAMKAILIFRNKGK